jgi:serine/threonine-protein kinase
MLTGNKPFNGDLNDQKVILLPLRYDLPPLSKNNPKISPAIENVIFRCIASKQDDLKYRYTNVKEIIKDVDDIINNPQEAKLAELIKPYNKRTIQANVFDIESEKSKLKFYNSS